jgi:hypothetical protein
MATVKWLGGDGNWIGDPQDWSTGAEPGADDSVIINFNYSVVTLLGDASAASLTINKSSVTFDLMGELNLGTTLALEAGTVRLGGEIAGGTIDAVGGDFVGFGGTLSALTFAGALDLTADNATITVADGTTFAVGATIDLTASRVGGAVLDVAGNATLDNATVTIGDDNGPATANAIFNLDAAGTGAVLTLGAHLTIDQTNVFARLASSDLAGDAIVNQGTIDAGFAGGQFAIDAAEFTNTGVIDVSGDDTLNIDSVDFTNLSAGVLTGGVYVVGAGSALEIADAAPIVTDDADITLSGAGSTLQTEASGSSVEESLDATLATIGAAGDLRVLGGRNFSVGTLADNGLLQLGGGTLMVNGSLSMASGGKLLGFGDVDSASVDNAGLIEASGGTLTLAGTPTGDGGLQVDASATLRFGLGGAYAGIIQLDGGALVGSSLTIGSGGELLGFGVVSATVLTNSGEVIAYKGTLTIVDAIKGAGDVVVTDDATLNLVADANYAGSIRLQTGTLDATSLTISSGGWLYGNGVVDVTTLTDSGDIEAIYGTLTVVNGIGGTGALTVEHYDSLDLVAGANFGGQIQLNDGILTGGALTIAKNGSLSGYGAVTSKSVADLGLIEASGGTLQLLTTVSGVGGLQVDQGAELSLDNDDSSIGFIHMGGGTLEGEGTLAVGGAFSGFGVIDAKSLSIDCDFVEASGGTLTCVSAISAVVRIDSGATFVETAETSQTTLYEFSGSDATLKIGWGGGTISGFALGDAIVFNAAANSATYDGSGILSLYNDGVFVSGQRLTGAYDDVYFLTKAVAGGTEVFALPTPATVADYLAETALYDQIVGGFEVSDSATAVVANLAHLNADAAVTSIAVTSGVATLRGGVGISAGAVSLSGAGTVLGIAENAAYGGVASEGVGAWLSIGAGDMLTLSGPSDLAGYVNGLGALALTGGAATIEASAKIRVAGFSAAGTEVTLAGSLAYAGAFTLGAGATVSSTGAFLYLTGDANFSGGSVDGAAALYTKGAATLSGLTLGGTAKWVNSATVTQQGGNLTIGDSSGSAATFDNAATGVYDIADDSGIGLGVSTSSSLINLGLLDKTGGAGASLIAANIYNANKILAAAGTLDLQGRLTGTGDETVAAGATLAVGGAVAATQTLAFSGSGGEISLDDLQASGAQIFHGAISGFGAGDKIAIGAATFVGFAENAGGASGLLTLHDGKTSASITMLGDYASSNFSSSIAGGQTVLNYQT